MVDFEGELLNEGILLEEELALGVVGFADEGKLLLKRCQFALEGSFKNSCAHCSMVLNEEK